MLVVDRLISASDADARDPRRGLGTRPPLPSFRVGHFHVHERPTLRLVLEIDCRVRESIAAALREIGRESAPTQSTDYASVSIAPLEQQVGAPPDSLEQEGMVRVYGPAQIHDAEIDREKLGLVLSRSDVRWSMTPSQMIDPRPTYPLQRMQR
jgi:hypothetical protein